MACQFNKFLNYLITKNSQRILGYDNDRTTINIRAYIGGRKCQRFAKLKEVFCQRTCQHKNTTFNFAQTHHDTTNIADKDQIV